MLQALRKFSKSWISSIFLGLIALSFALWGINDIFRGNTDTTAVAVGSNAMSSDAFQREYQNVLRNQSRALGIELTPEQALKAIAPGPRQTAFWLHLGANLAARDWHDSLGEMTPLPGTDSQRYLVVSPPLLAAARAEFAGLAGLEAPYGTDRISAGELTGIIDAGYRPVAGVFGLHRFHHVAEDDARCLSAGAVGETAGAFLRLVERALSGA